MLSRLSAKMVSSVPSFLFKQITADSVLPLHRRLVAGHEAQTLLPSFGNKSQSPWQRKTQSKEKRGRSGEADCTEPGKKKRFP